MRLRTLKKNINRGIKNTKKYYCDRYPQYRKYIKTFNIKFSKHNTELSKIDGNGYYYFISNYDNSVLGIVLEKHKNRFLFKDIVTISSSKDHIGLVTKSINYLIDKNILGK